ncbi:dystonin isoform X25 [Zootoca vivipara]|uniref:dystonin isoform X25 n=1 Tax=Zootoca vivipara TaxID=8524 RepID=UPI00293BE07A|nr:dystonin isoform X25 [Zootoca vivipara]
MIAAAFLVLLRPYSIQCALLLLLLLLGTVATILFFCYWHRKLQKGRHPIKSVFSGRSRSRDAAMRSHHFRSEVIYLARNLKGFRPSPRHIRRRVVPRLEEREPLVEVHQLSEQETSVKKRKIKKSSRVQPEFYHSVQVTPTRKPSSGNASYRCSMSSSADFSDDDDFSQKSGSLSPAPGDTLPWNLPKHERSKRKIQGGSVLDPAERAVLRIADERDKVQKKTFTKWINQHLMKVRKHVNDLYEDLRDGHNLISLLEVLSGDTLPRERDFLKTLRLPREKGRMRFHRLQNVQIALDYLKRRQVKLVNIRNDDITDGNPKLTLGLIWTIILHFQISDIHVTGESEDMSAKERLLLWTQQTTEGYAGIRCENFTTCWRDGKLFNAIIHKYRPDLIDMNTVAVQSNLANLEHAFFVAEKLGVARLLDPEDVDVSSPDEKSVITYVSSLYDAFPKVPEGGEGISAHDVEVKWVEYQNMVNYLIQWIRHHATMMTDRAFPNNPVELKALYNQYLQFKETEIPPKEIEKSKIKHLYKLLEVWIEFGRIKLPQGYHPNDIEKEWGKLIIAMLEREKTLRPEVERLEMLQQIANRIQRDSLGCEDKLMLARNAVQSDAKRLESGLQFQNEAEIAGYLLECENLLRQQVLDAQILIDGKYYQADQLIQRVAKLRDDLMALRAECSSVYSKGRTLTTEQTKMMISGITQSLNSGFAPNFSPSLNSGLSQGLSPSLTSSSLTSGLSSGFSSRMTPAITPAYTPGFPPRLIQSYITGVDTGALQTLKLMQIRKPLMKSAFIDQNLTEEEVNMKFVQDLLRWVDEMQVQLDRAEWGSDLPSVESHLENHKNVHKAIEEFESSLKEAKISEIQMTAPLKLSYADKLHKLESQYAKLLNTSRNQERHIDTLHNFVSRATRELIWLNEKEEEEVAYDWSERNTNIARKKDYHAELMRELDQKEEIIKSVQEIAEQLLFENHPARLTIEAYRAAMQTQWSWILQLCQCVEQHLRENTAYFEFFNDAKEAIDYLKNLRDAVHRKYSCDRSSSIHKLEDLIQESMEEKEQLLQYKNTVAGLVGRAKTIVQLKPRNPDNPLKTSIPIKAICDYRQIEITIYRDDECVLASNSHRAKWKVISPSGNEAMVPSVCFTVPPPNKEAIDTANRIEQQYQNVLALWHESHVNMKSVVSWHYLTNEIETVRASNVASIKTLLPGEHQQVLSNLQSRFDDFLEDSQESKAFSVADIAQLEREVNVCKQYYQELLKSAEREEHEESIYNLYISEVRNMRLRLENCEDRLIRQIRTPLERDDLHESVFRISEQEKLKKDLDRLKEDLETITDKCDDFFSQAAGSPSVPTLRSELNLVIQNMNQVYSMSSIYIEKLKTINLVLKNTQGAEALVKLYETKLCEEEPLTADKSNIENLMATLKQWRSEVDVKREVFHALEDELQKAKAISDQMFKTHKERDLDFDWHKEKADQLTERWQNVHSQIENRLRDLEAINKSLKYYRDTYGALDNWIKQVEETQQRFQENPPQNSKALAKQLNQQKMLVSEIETKQNKLDECQKHSEQYSAAVKDYELQTMTYRAMVDSQQKSPVKRRRMQSSSDFIIQEFMDLRTRYTALVTLMTQYIKFAGDSLKRLEEEEILKNKEAMVRGEYSELEEQQKEVMSENRKLMERINELEEMLDELRKEKFQLEAELPKAKADAEKEIKKQLTKMEEISLQKAKAEQEAKRYRMELEDALKEKEDAEQELEHVKQLALKNEAQRSMVEEKFRAFRMQLEETAVARDALEDKLRRKDTNLQDLEQQKKALMEELRKKTAEEEKLVKLIKEMEQDIEFQGSLVKSKCREKEITEVRRQITIIGQETLLPTGSDIFREKQEVNNIEEFQQLVHELTFANKKSEKTIKDLKYELCELELQNASAEEKARLLKEKLDDANNSLRRLKIELDQKELVEQGYLEQLKELDRQLQKTTGKAEEVMQEAMDLKKINTKYQEELRSLQKEKALLKKELEELARTHTHTGITIQQLHSQITSLQQEKMAAEQRTVSFRGEATNLQEQFKKMQEQFLQKTREEKENQLKIQRLKDDLADSNHLVEKLKQKVEELSRWNSETKIMMTEVRTDSEKIILERQIIDRKNDELKALAEGFKEQLRITNEQLHKQIILEQEHLDHIKRLEDELIKAKELAGEFKQKCDRDNAYNMNAEMEIRNLRTQMSTFTMEMKMNEQKIQQQQSHIHELNGKMKKLQDDLHQKTLEEQMARQNMALLQEESIAFKHSAEEFRKKFEKLLETHNIAENDISGIRMECITLQQENHMAQDNIRMYKLQIEDLQDRLQKSREQLQQGKHAEMEYVQKYRKMEEELQMQRRTVENLKHQIDLQKRDHGNQLRWFQNEINKRNIQLDFGWKGNGFSYLGDTSPRDFEHINICTTTSPLLRRRHLSSSSCKSEPLVAQKLQAVATDSLQREKPFQLSGVTPHLENGISQQSYAEYVSQTSTEFEITVDKSRPITRISEIDKLRDGKLLSSRHEESYEVGLGKRLHPLEKSVEEEKKEHVEKAGDLLKWVSNITKTFGKGGGEKSEKADSPKKQISSDELLTKKEQISEALQTTQTFLAKHGDKMTDEEKNEMENHVRSLQEGYKLLSNEDLKQLQQEQDADNENVDEKDLADQHQDFTEKLQDICDLLTQTENQLIGHKEALAIEDTKAELQQYQIKQEELQKDMQANTQALAEIVKNTEMFLKENGEKLRQEDKTALEKKLNEAKTKCLLLSQKAEESRKQLDKAVTTAIKQETEKVAAREQLEESKSTIENLLDWLSNVDKDAEHGGKKGKPAIKQNGTHFQEGEVEGLAGEDDEVNGNLMEIQQQNETHVDGQLKPPEDNLNMQYQKAKAQHEKIISQQQAVIIATQSTQALLEKQGHHLSPEEKEKIQRNMKELKVQYETALAESEQKLKLTRSLQEELEKFDADYGEFESWLQQGEQELDNLETGASDFNGIIIKLKRQKSFSEDVISHKGDLRYITISGQRVLDAAKSCNKREGVKYDKEGIDTSSTYIEVQNKLDSATGRFKSLYSKCSILGNNLKDLVDKYQNYEDTSSGLLTGLQASEEAVNKQLSEAVAVDPKNLQRQLEETKVLQGQVSGHQVAVEKLKKAAEVLFDTRGELLPDKDEIQNTLDTIVDKYNHLSKAVNDRNEKLQITLTRSLSVQDGLDEMLDWMNGVEKSLEEQGQVPLNSSVIQDVISKSMALEQDIVGRQSSLNAMKEKLNKFMETTDPSTASSLQAKMDELSQRFCEANNKHRKKLEKLDGLKTRVELFECLTDKLQSFLDKKTQALSEADIPGKDVTEMSLYVQETNTELMEQKKDLENLQHLIEELSPHALPGDRSLVLEKVNALSKKFKEMEETVREKEEDVSSCQKQMDEFNLHVESLKKWVDEMTERIPAIQPSLNVENLNKHLQNTKHLEEEWRSKAPDIQKMISRGTALCNLISAVTSPARSRGVKSAVSGTVLNGEGAATGTQGFLTNKEVTTVQHNMSTVSHSYDDLGAVLKEKRSELESTLSNMQNIQRESNSMMEWLQNMDTAAAKWEATLIDSEAVKEQVDQHKLFETELKQNENKVQELKDRVTELLEKNPDSPEAPKWKQMLDKIDSKWRELSQVTSDRQKKLEESSNYLTQFQATEAQLKQWLVEKELMVSVLGPLSIDPNMLNTQKQQVQILLNEFDTRKPQYEQLNSAGQGIMKRPGEHPPSHEMVKQQLAAVAQKWDGLTGQLSDRCNRIDQAILKSTEYQSCLKSLSEKLSVLDDKFNSSLAISTDPDSVKRQLEVAREVKEEIERETPKRKAAQALCEELSALVAEDYLKAELARQLDGILKPFHDMEQKAGNHIEQLQSTYVSSNQFQQMSKDFQAWLDKKKEEQNQPCPISTKLESLWTLIDGQKEFKAALSDQTGSYEKLIAEGESLLQKTQGAEKAELQAQLNLLRGNWDEMNKQVKERQDKLNDCLEKALRYREHVENLQPWIAKCQSNISQIEMSIDPVRLENSIAQVKTWQKDLDKHQGLVELLSNAAETLLSACQTDKDIIEEEKTLLIQNMDIVTEQLHAKRDGLEKMSQRLKEFQESSKDVEEQLKNAREQLETHDSLKPQTYSNKHLTIMQTQQKTLQTVKAQVDLTKKLAQELVADASDSSGVSDLLLQAETLEEEFSTISQQVDDKCSFLETKLQGIGHFQNSIREMFSQFAEFDDELDSMDSVGRDLVTLQSQRKDIKTFLKKLEELITSNENANNTCKMMLANEAEASPDLAGIKRDLEALNKQCNKLLDRAKARDEQIEGIISRVEEFYSKLKGFSKLLGEVEEHEESQGSVGMEIEMINQQLNVFKVFEKEKIEPLQVKQQEVNWLGQGLIQSAAKNASTDNLERDLEDVNTRWKTLNKKVAQRAAQLQEALLHCGRFQDAVESILSWLIDTEDLVANQKPPSAEFKVVKAQIQEQKLLQRLLDDRRPTVELIKREGEKIAESAEPADKEKILKQLSLLDSRWDALLDKAETRNRQLEGISAVAQQFHETLEPLVEWLTITEKRLSNSEPIGTQASKLQQQISQHKAFEEDIATRNKNLQQAINIGQALKALSSKEDKEMVQEKLYSSEAQYTEIREKSGSRAQLLQQAYCNAQIFGEDEVELMNWLNEVHEKLSKLAVQDYNTDLLVKQQTEMLALQEEILLRKQNVDQAIQNGLELLKQTTGDEVVIIQDKLEGIKTRYKDITKLSSDVSKTLEQALQLSGQLQSAHEKLCTWLDKVEVELQLYEAQVPKGEELSQAQERQKALKKEAKDNKCLLDTLNEVSSALLELVPWRAREGIDKMITEDNERYRLVNDTITQKVEEIDAAIFRSQQFDQAAGTELAWVEETEIKLMSLGDIRLERDQTIAQLQVQKAFTMEILKHKDTIEELVASGDEIMKTCTEEDKQTMKKKLENLLQKYNTLCQMNSKRNLQLERAQSLASQFWETYEEIWPWLTETKTVISQLPAPALEYETLKQQQEEHRQLRELIAEHKPHIDKMNKTGPQLLELSPREGFSIQEKYVAADALYSRIKEDVKKRAQALDEAISQSTQFHDKIDSTTESLERIVERLRQPPSISAEVEKIKEQIGENKNVSVDLEKLQPVYETLKQRGEEMIARSEGADKDISAKVVQDKLDQMVFMWEDIHTLAEEREAKLLDAMELAEKFWCDHMALIATIKDTQDFIRELEGAGIDPSVVKQQQEAAETIKEEIDGLQEDLDVVVSLGSELIAACGEPDKPLVNKSIDELNSASDALNKAWKERVDKLEEAMQAAVQYQDGLQALFDWVDIAGSKLAVMSPVGTDLETVKQQTEEMKQFKKEAYQQQIEMERLNHQAELLLKKVTEESDKHTVQDPLSELKLLWESLEDKIVSRQHKLEGALLALGQFQHALDELLAWLTHTEDLLNEQKPVGGDPKAIEIELAKHHVLQNDVLAHQSTVETVKKAGNDLIQSSAVEEASNLQSKLELLNQRWQNVLEKTEKRKLQLDSALIQAQGFHGEVEDLQQWLTETERQLLASKPVGGLPETAREQLNIHMELCAAFEAKEETYKCLMQKGLQMLARCLETIETNVEQDINNLKEKWESVETKLSERKIKLEEALNLAMEFHNSLQDFINWLTQAEQTLTVASRPSLILDTVLFQIDEHKVFANEVNAHRDQIIELDKTGTHLKYFSQKQDVVLIKNLLISVQSRWEKVVQRLVERGRALDDARKRAKQFHEAWNKLTEWLDDSEKTLDAELEIANDPDKIKMQLAQHKEFQKALGAKHSVYDTTNRSGRALKEKTSLADDNLKLDDMLSELRDKWDTVCGKSVERQNKLEEALLFSGQFTDALQALIDWLYKVEPQLAEDQPVHGDIDLVMNLIDNHKAFQKELGKRTGSVQALKRSARELIEGSRDDSSWVKVQMQELGTRWETVCALSVSKQIRLEQALHQAEEFHSVVHVLLEWLAEAEQALRFHGNLPDDEESLRTLIDQHREFMRKLEEKKAELTKATGMGEAILAICHPDSITTIKHWITIIRARFEEVSAWAKQHQQRLAGALAALITNQELLEALLTWLQWAETTLSEKDKEVIPQEIDDVKALIAEHQTFMEEMTRKQPDVDKVTKTHKRKAADSGPIHSHIPVLDKGRGGRKRSPTPSMYPSGAQAQIETKNPRVNLLVSKWQQVWLLALERRRKLNDALDRLEELKEFANFDFDIWRKKYMRWMNHKKSRVMDFFRRIDKDQDGKITRQEFIDGILSSKFPTSRLEMSAVADIFDRDGDGYIDYYEFVAALHPNKDAYKPLTDADKIEDEVTRQVAKCKCAKRFQVEQIGDNKYRFFLGNQFGDSQQLRLVRILRSTVMVRVGGGWMALDEFLVKNDPCRVHHHGSKMLRSESNSSITTQPTIAKGRTNMELREKFILADGASQSMAAFRQRGRRSRPSSRGASPNRSMSVSNPPAQGAPTSALAASTPKTPHHLTRNYGKPWLINSKTSSPCKPPECSEYQVSSTEGTPIQGSKLRLPGYLSGKGFHSGEDSSLISTAATRVRAHFADTPRKTPSRPGSRAGSKAGSRASSRRGSDASDFDISEIQSVCSDVSETVHTPIRPTPRPNSRSASGKPSKIPTPQRKLPASKLDKSSKR